jgi:hypothetical protein
MRRRVRRPSYVDPVLDQRARAYAIAHGLTDSAVTEAALKKYLDEGSVDEALVVRRLDCVKEVVTKILHDLNVLGVAFGGYARFSFISAPAVTPEAIRRADSANRAFLESAFKRPGLLRGGWKEVDAGDDAGRHQATGEALRAPDHGLARSPSHLLLASRDEGSATAGDPGAGGSPEHHGDQPVHAPRAGRAPKRDRAPRSVRNFWPTGGQRSRKLNLSI